MTDKTSNDSYHVFVSLFSNPDVIDGRLGASFRTISEVCARTLDCERITIWRPTAAEYEFCCVDAYDHSQNSHTMGEKLIISRYPNFYGSMLNERCINIKDAAVDMRTIDLYNEYWKPHHSTSILAASVRVRGRFEGFVCFERASGARAWTKEEEALGCQIGDLIGLVVLTRQNNELQKHLDVYEATLKNVTQAVRPETAFRELVRYAALLIDADSGMLFVSDPKRQECRCTISYEAPARFKGMTLKFGEDVAGTTAETGRAIIQGNYQAWLDRSDQYEDSGFSEILAVPFGLRGDTNGVIQLMRRETGRAFVEWDRKMLETIGLQAAVMLEQSRMADGQARLEGHKQAIYQMVDEAAHASDLALLAQACLDLTLECLALDVGSIQVGSVVASQGFSPEEEGLVNYQLDPDGRGFSTTIRVEDWSRYSGAMASLAPLMNKSGIRSSMFIPILSNGVFSGRISVHAPVARAWSLEGIHQLETMAKLIGLSADKLTSHQYLDSHARLLGKLNTVTSGLNRLIGFDEGVRLVGQGFVNLVEADQAVVFLRNPDGSIQCPWTHKLAEIPLNRVIQAEDAEIARTMFGTTRILTIPEIHSYQLPLQFKKMFESQGVHSLVCLPLIYAGQVVGAVIGSFKARRDILPLEQNVFVAFSNQAAVTLQNAWMQAQMEQGYTDVTLALAKAMDGRDSTVPGQAVHLASWAEEIGRKLNLSELEIKDLHWAAVLHNIGKASMPDEVVRNPGSLSEEEKKIIQESPLKGAEMVQPLAFFRGAGQIIRSARERFDGDGYPDRLKGEDIPLPARILSVVDAFGSMTADRPYRNARSPSEAIQELEEASGTQFDPEVVTAFVQTYQKENGKNGKHTLRKS